jgi:hypothetical protein
MNCEWPTLTAGTPCNACGNLLPRDYDEPPVHVCPGAKSEPGLGDAVESLLASIGITKDRYAQAKELFGLPATCSCDARREWLNRVSDWWRGQ